MDIRKWYNFHKLKRNHHIYVISIFMILLIGFVFILTSQILLKQAVKGYAISYYAYGNIDFDKLNYKNGTYAINFFSIFNIGIAGIFKVRIYGLKNHVYQSININSLKYIAFLGFMILEIILPLMILIYSVSFIIFWADINTTNKKTIKYTKKDNNVKVFQKRDNNILREWRIKSAIGK